MSRKSIKANAVLNIIRLVSSILLPMISYPYVSRILGPTQLGKIDFAASAINYFSLIAGLGIPSYGIICCSKVRSNKECLKRTALELLIINLGLTLIAYIALLISVFTIPQFKERQVEIMIYSLSMLFTAIGIDWLYSALEDFKYITIRSIIFKVVSVILILILVKSKEDYLVYECILIFSTVGSNVLNFVHARHYIDIKQLRKLNFRHHLKPILLFAASSIAGTINANTDVTMLGIIKGNYEVGLYSFSTKFKNILISLNNAALVVMVPRLSYYAGQELYKEYKELLKKAADSVMAVACGIPILFSVFSVDTILVLGGKNYIQAKIAMIVLNISIIIIGITWVLGVGVLQTIGRQNKYAKTIWISMVVNVSVNAILIPYMGAAGAAIATLLTEILNAILFYIYSKDILGNYIKWFKYSKLVLASLVIALLIKKLLSVLQLNYFVELLLASIIWGVVYGIAVLVLLKNVREIVMNSLIKFKEKMVGEKNV